MKTKDTIRYLLRKFAKMLFTIWLVTTIIFFLIRLMPSNPVDRYIENQMVQYGLTYEDAKARAAHLFSMDLEKPLAEQYVNYISRVVRLDFGDSLLTPGLFVAEMTAVQRTEETPGWEDFADGGARNDFCLYHRGRDRCGDGFQT